MSVQWLQAKAANLSNRAAVAWSLARPDRSSWCRRILFSPQPTWEPMIRRSFAGRHAAHLEFAEFTQDRVRAADLVVPLSVEAARLLHAHPQWNVPTPMPLPAPEVVALCSDKVALNLALIDHGFGDHVPSMQVAGRYPHMLKKRCDENSVHTHVVHGPQDAARWEDCVSDPAYYTQRFVPGRKEYATHLLMRDGQAAAHLTVEYAFRSDTPIKGKDPSFHRLVACPDLRLLVHMLRAIGYEGLCCFNFKVEDGRVQILELNPRFGGSLAHYFVLFVRRLECGAASIPTQTSAAAARHGGLELRP